MSDEASDPELVRRARQGDGAAFARLYERHRDVVFRFAARFLGSTEAAEDITHDCFLALVSRPLRFDPERASLRTYLCGAARNLAFNSLRAAARLEDDGQEVNDRPTPDPHPLQALLATERTQAIRAAVSALPPLQREVLILVEYEECTLAAVAAIVGADVGTVKARLHRARQSLRRELSLVYRESRTARNVGGT